QTGTPTPALPARGGAREDQRHWFFLGAGATLWTTWQVSTAIGLYVGARIPASWNLEFALPLTFVALVVPAVTDRATAAAAVAALVAWKTRRALLAIEAGMALLWALAAAAR